MGTVVVDDGPTTICDMGADVVRGTVAVGVLWDVIPGLVLIVTDGIPVTVEHMFSNARNEKMYKSFIKWKETTVK